MEEAFLIRLKLLNDNIELLIKNGQDILQRAKTARDDSSNADSGKMTYMKLRSAMDRFITDTHQYFRLAKTPSADVMSIYTATQIRADEVVVELDLTFNLNGHQIIMDTRSESHRPTNVTSKLPKIELARFSGDVLKWHQFWDQFDSNIGSRDIKDVDKLLYLQSVLDGEAKRALEGLDITNKNYPIAVSTLKERYGKHNTIVDAHYTALYNIKVADKSVLDCRRAYNEIERHLRVLASLGEDTSHNHLRVIIMQKFPEDLIYELRLKADSDSCSIEEIRKRIETIISAKEASNRIKESMRSVTQPGTSTRDNHSPYSLETLHVRSEQQSTSRYNVAPRDMNNREERRIDRRYITRPKENKKEIKRNPNYVIQRKRFFEGERKDVEAKRIKPMCIFCGKGHFNDMCNEFKSIIERKRKLEGRCYNCFGEGHQSSQCRSGRKCYHCGKYNEHNRALCPSKISFKTENLHINHPQNRNHEGFTVLQTAIVEVSHGGKRQEHQVFRILLDCGSQRSYVTRKVAEYLNLTYLETNTLSVFTFGTNRPNEIVSPVVQLDLNTRTNNKISIYANVVPHITNGVPTVPVNFRGHDLKEIIPGTVVLADDSSVGDQIDILVGNDYYYSLMTGDKVKVCDDLYLVNSIFGWLWSGRFLAVDQKHSDKLSVLTYFQSSIELNGLCKPDLPLQRDDLKKLWDLESIGIMDSPTTTRDDEAIAQFNATTQYYDNRYHVKWPWINYPPDLSSNFGLAHGRLISLLKRLDQNTIQSYDKILTEQLELGIIEITYDSHHSKPEHPIHYLPHHGIAKGDKLRLVYDASSKSNGNKSLNECLYRGPLLLKDLTGLLIRFREHRVGVVADVEKAFLQIGLQDEDRDVTRFLWLKDISQGPAAQNLLHLRFCRVPFGVISSPFLLNAVIRYHLLKANNRVCHQIAEDLYVDNLVTGSDTVEGALSLHSTARNAFSELSMNLREWNSNSAQVMDSIPEQQRSKELGTMKVLGLNWDIRNDSLSLRFELTKELEDRTTTKREVLRLIASIFDPCGYVVPLLLPAKVFLHILWQEKVDWDTPFTNEMLEKCKSALENLKMIKNIQIPRCVMIHGSPEETTSNELHVFTDASEQAYAAVVYLRVSHGPKVATKMIMGKGRLAGKEQKNELQIPKLELLGVFIGTKLIQSVVKHTKLHITKMVLWTDSQIVISWCSTNKTLPPFVARRVDEIKQITNLEIRYVPTQLNPADVATRPNASAEGIKHWLEGPNFLKQDPKEWPTRMEITGSHATTLIDSGGEGPSDVSVIPDTNLPDYVNQPVGVDEITEGLKGDTDEEMIDIEKNNDGNDQKIYLEENEDQFLEKIRQIQSECYEKEARGINTDLVRSLGVYKDKDGLLRCQGRLCNTDWSYDQKHPILLPRNHEVTSKIIQMTHQRNYHVGVSHTLSQIRKKYWIPKGRSQVQKVLRRCLPCLKHSGGPFKLPPMASLPKERVTYSHPFTYTGLDYFGPITVRNNDQVEKRWVSLFTCLAVRAIHMEVVVDMTAEECLLAIRRFAATRGVPKMIISDNAAQFKLTAEVLTSEYCIANSVKWRFIPELAPWFGGFYERLIGLVKHCLKRTVDKHLMNPTQLKTIIKEVETVVNTRPLTIVSDEIDHVLAPADFLCTGGITIPLESQKECFNSGTSTKLDLIEGWKRGQRILKEYTEMFVNQYLTSLRERGTMHKQSRVTVDAKPQIGQLVQVKGGSNRLQWKVGRISSLVKSKDGEIRVAKVDIGPGETLNRSIAHLYPLEVSDCDHDSQDASNSHTQPMQVTRSEPNRVVDPGPDQLSSDARNESNQSQDDSATNQLSSGTQDQLDQSQTTPAQDQSTDGVELTSDQPQRAYDRRVRPTRLSAQRARQMVRKWTAHLLYLSEV